MQKIILIVGQSGAGKDTLLNSASKHMECNFVKRYITRSPDETENNYYISWDCFKTLSEIGYFIAEWSAHSNLYGIAKNDIKEGTNIISVSRQVVEKFEHIFEDVITIEITAPKEVLLQRLKERGREKTEEQQKRLERMYEKINAKKLVTFNNYLEKEASSRKFVELLKRIK
ncbi:AAA family ATPase [Flexistipes sinusarabici]|uniref:AAA family ATPase n=1 Tax=Flexistipes sinusarabici TaxID=2352 RepID=UPI002352A29E|nr:AAA family ATPase [Flexistipes sinusarabici]